jgi:hypothetical protein
MGETRGACRDVVGKPGGREQLEDPGVDRRMILKWIFKKWDGGAWSTSICLRKGTDGGHL